MRRRWKSGPLPGEYCGVCHRNILPCGSKDSAASRKQAPQCMFFPQKREGYAPHLKCHIALCEWGGQRVSLAAFSRKKQASIGGGGLYEVMFGRDRHHQHFFVHAKPGAHPLKQVDSGDRGHGEFLVRNCRWGSRRQHLVMHQPVACLPETSLSSRLRCRCRSCRITSSPGLGCEQATLVKSFIGRRPGAEH